MADMALVQNIGVSNFNIDLLRELVEVVTTVKVSIVQNWMDPFNQDTEVRDYCRDNDITYMAYSSFGTQWEHKLQHNPVFTNPLLLKIASKHRATIAQVVISWLLQEGVVAIPRSSSGDHVRDNASSLDVNPLTLKIQGINVFLDDEDMREMRSLDGILGPLWD
jgi:diketogulonate reductase-like aldo/keto reductase